MLTNPKAVEKIVTHVIPAKDFQKGFDLMEEGLCGKVVLDFTEGNL